MLFDGKYGYNVDGAFKIVFQQTFKRAWKHIFESKKSSFSNRVRTIKPKVATEQDGLKLDE